MDRPLSILATAFVVFVVVGPITSLVVWLIAREVSRRKALAYAKAAIAERFNRVRAA